MIIDCIKPKNIKLVLVSFLLSIQHQGVKVKPTWCWIWILYSYLSDMSTCHLFSLATVFLLEWHVYPSPVQSGYCIPTWVTCLPVTCSVWILYSYLSDMSTRHLFSLDTVFLLEWHVYLSPVQSGYCIPTWVTCLPVTCSSQFSIIKIKVS
jgi:hypothetical protein